MMRQMMRRFLPADIHEQTLDRDREALARSITGLYTELKQRLFDDTNDNDSGGDTCGHGACVSWKPRSKPDDSYEIFTGDLKTGVSPPSHLTCLRFRNLTDPFLKAKRGG